MRSSAPDHNNLLVRTVVSLEGVFVGEYVVRFSLPNGVFLPCDHGLDFLHQLMWEFNQSNNVTVLSTCPLYTNSGCGKERRIVIGSR